MIPRGFTLSLPPAIITPVHRVWIVAHTDALGTTRIANHTVSSGQAFVLTNLVFRAFATGVATGNLTELGIDNPYMLAECIQFALSVDGSTPGRFTGVVTTSEVSGLFSVRMNLADMLGFRYGAVIQPGGRIETYGIQYGVFGAGATVPTRLGCEISGFTAPPQYVDAYLRDQGAVDVR